MRLAFLVAVVGSALQGGCRWRRAGSEARSLALGWCGSREVVVGVAEALVQVLERVLLQLGLVAAAGVGGGGSAGVGVDG